MTLALCTNAAAAIALQDRVDLRWAAIAIHLGQLEAPLTALQQDLHMLAWNNPTFMPALLLASALSLAMNHIRRRWLHRSPQGWSSLIRRMRAPALPASSTDATWHQVRLFSGATRYLRLTPATDLHKHLWAWEQSQGLLPGSTYISSHHTLNRPIIPGRVPAAKHLYQVPHPSLLWAPVRHNSSSSSPPMTFTQSLYTATVHTLAPTTPSATMTRSPSRDFLAAWQADLQAQSLAALRILVSCDDLHTHKAAERTSSLVSSPPPQLQGQSVYHATPLKPFSPSYQVTLTPFLTPPPLSSFTKRTTCGRLSRLPTSSLRAEDSLSCPPY